MLRDESSDRDRGATYIRRGFPGNMLNFIRLPLPQPSPDSFLFLAIKRTINIESSRSMAKSPLTSISKSVSSQSEGAELPCFRRLDDLSHAGRARVEARLGNVVASGAKHWTMESRAKKALGVSQCCARVEEEGGRTGGCLLRVSALGICFFSPRKCHPYA